MKKRLLSWLMVLTLCLTLLPTAAFAAGEEQDPTEAGEETLIQGQPEEPEKELAPESEPALLAVSGISTQAAAHDHCLCGATHKAIGDHTDANAVSITFTAWTDELAEQQNGSGKTAANSLPSTGNDLYYLTKDVELSTSWKPADGTVLCLNGYSITSTSYNYGIMIDNGVTFTLTDCNGSNKTYHFSESNKLWKLDDSGSHTVTGGILTSGGSGVYIWSGTFNMYGGTIVGNSGNSNKGGGVFVGFNGSGNTFNMYGGAITGNRVSGDSTSDGGAGVYVCGDSNTFNMYGGEITNNATRKYASGGGVNVYEKATFNMTGGTIGGEGKGNTSSWGGGGVYMTGKSTFNLYGGQITSNTATGSGGGVYSEYNSSSKRTFNMYGGEISDNNGALGGGGVYYGNGTFTMCGGEISGNSGGGGRSKNGGGGVCIVGTMTVSGDVKITGNTEVTDSVSTNNNVYLRGSDAVITIGEDGLNNAKIGVTAKTPSAGLVIATGAAENKNYTEIITSDDDTYEVAHDSTDTTKLVLKVAPEKPHTHFLCTTGNTCTKVGGHDCGSSKITFIKWTDELAQRQNGNSATAATSLPKEEGNYYLTGPVTLSEMWAPADGTVLCLNGQTITAADNFDVIKVGGSTYADHVNFTLVDCKGGNQEYGKITHAADKTGRGVWVVNSGSQANVFTMYGGNITKNGTYYGGGVFVGAGSTFTMYDGAISGNTAGMRSSEGENSGCGGGVCIFWNATNGRGTFTMHGGSIADNQAEISGGGVYIAQGNGAFTMSGGEISKNKALQDGGGIYIVKNTYSNATGGTFTMSGDASITENHCGGNYQGGGVYVTETTTFTVSGAAKITGNKVDGKANNVYLPSSKTITIGGKLTGGDKSIGVTSAKTPGDNSPVTIATGVTDDYSDKFTSDKDGFEVQYDATDKKLALATKTTPTQEHEHDLCGTAHTPVGDHQTEQEVTFATELKQVNGQLTMGSQPWSAKSITINGSTPNCYVLPAGSYYLGSDLALDASIYISENVQLCLNGNSIISNGDNVGRDVVIVDTASSGAFTLANCRNGGSITHATGKNGCGVYMNGNRTKFNMYGGIITGNNSGGVNVTQTNTFNMYGGSITNNSNGYGGGVYNGGTVNMYGGEISDNTASNKGGGVYMEASTGNYQGGILNVSGSAKITSNTVDGTPNNIYLPANKTITIGGELTGGAQIGVTPSSWPTGTATKKIATQATDGNQNYVKSDDNAYEVKYDNGNLVLGLKGSNPQPGKVDAGVKITAENANDPAPTKVVYGDTFKLGTTLQTTGTAGSPQSSKWTWTSSDRDVLSVTGSGSAAAVKALKSGEATITVTYESENAKGTATATITVNKREISVKADNKDMTVGGELPAFTVTYGNFASGNTANTVLETQPVPTTTADGKTAGSFDITVTAPTLKSDYTDKYTVGTPQKGTLTVKAASTPSTPSTPSSGSSSGSSTIKTETTTTNPDGSTTKTETKSDGTVIETTTNPDGSTSKTESKTTTKSNGSTVETVTETNTGADGSKSTSKTETTINKDGSKTEAKTETKTEADGTKSETKSETKTDANGVTSGTETTKTTAPNGSTGTTTTTTENGNTKTEAETKISNKAVEDAKKSGEAVKVPTEVKAGEDSDSAPTVKVELPKNAGKTKIEIPVSDVNSGTVAVIVHPDGTEEIVKDSKPTADGVELTVDGSATVKVIDNSKDFIDTRNHWSRDEVNFVVSREIFNGVGGNLFGVGQPMTRGMVNTVLARLAGIDTTPENGQKWYEVGTEWAKANGITDGTNPEASVTREQLATLLYRFCGTPTVSGVLSFADAGEVSDYAQSALLWATQNDILNGVGNNRVAPNADAQRAQVAAMMARYLKNVG